MYCVQCGTANPDTNKFCHGCGAELAQPVHRSAESAQGTPYEIPPPQPPRPGLGRNTVLAAGGGVIGLAAVAVVVLLLFGGSSSSSHMMVSFPNRDDRADLYLLKLGQTLEEGVLITEDATKASQMWMWYREKNGDSSFIGGEYGGFAPDTNWVLYRYEDDDEYIVRSLQVGDNASSETFSANQPPVYVTFYDSSGYLLLSERRDDQWRCYLAKPGEEAERVAKGERCWASSDGSTILVQYEDEDGTTTSILDADKREESVALEEIEGLVATQVSDDGSTIAYVRETDDGHQLFLLDRGMEEPAEAGNELYTIHEHRFFPDSDQLYYLAENDDGLLELYTSATPSPVATGFNIAMAAGADDRYLVYMVQDEDGEDTLFVHEVKSGETTELLTGDELQFSVISSPDRILIMERDRDEVTLYSAPMNGRDLVQLFREDDITLESIRYVRDGSRLYMVVKDDDDRSSLFATPLDRAEGFYLLDDWYQIGLLNASSNERQLVFWTVEDRGDEPVLYTISVEASAGLVELDDDGESYQNAVFAPNSKTILYTARVGNRADDFEIRQVRVNARERPRDIYEEALLQDVRWDELNPFRSVPWTHLRSPSSWCPGSPTVHKGDDLRDRIAAGDVKCYRFRAEPGDLVTFDVDSAQPRQYDLELTLYDASGNRIDRDSTSGGSDPRLTFAVQQGGAYYVQLTGRGFSGDAAYSFLVHDGLGEPALDAAQRLPASSRIRDSITQASQLEIETFGWIGYGQVYYFDGQANQRVVLDVFADSINSDLDPQVQLLDRRLQSLAYDRGGGWGSDAQLTQTLRETGRYYVLVTDTDQGYGSPESFFYEILLTIQ